MLLTSLEVLGQWMSSMENPLLMPTVIKPPWDQKGIRTDEI